jgi:NHL repeat
MDLMMNRMNFRIAALIVMIASLGLYGCAESPELPTSLSSGADNFGANDTSFVRITPDWGIAAGYDWENPGEIHIARDGYLYVTDERDGGRVVRMKLDGSPVNDDLFTSVIDTTGRVPIGLGQDSKLNLYMVDGSNNIYARNSLFDEIPVTEVVVSFDVVDLRTDERYTIDDSTPIYEQINILFSQGIDSIDVDFNSVETTTDPETLTRFMGEHVFISDSSGEHPSRFTDVDGGPAGEEMIYVTDQGNDRIAQFAIVPSRILILSNGETTFSFAGLYIQDPVEFGSGQVSTNNPTSVVTTGGSNSTRLYFTQIDGNFLVQRLRPSGSSWQFDINASGDGPPIIELNHFGDPVAIAVGESDADGLGLFYVADSTQNRVTAFYPGGATFRHVAAESQLIDLEPGQFIEDALVEMEIEWFPDLNQGLEGYYSSESVTIQIEAGQTLLEAVTAAGYEFVAELNPNAIPNQQYVDATIATVNIPAKTTVSVYSQTLDKPRGVATKDGTVYIVDSGNNRILRFSRSDSDSYIPNDPNFP